MAAATLPTTSKGRHHHELPRPFSETHLRKTGLRLAATQDALRIAIRVIPALAVPTPTVATASPKRAFDS
jgi:hypothetical protein